MNNNGLAIYLIFLVLPIIELKFNYNETDFPEYHEKRINFDICCIFLSLVPFLLIISILCGPFCFCLYIIFLIIFSFAAIYYAFSTFYLYFAYDGSKRIKNRAIRILFWISFINFLINLFTSCCCFPSTYENNQESRDIEMDEQKVPLISNSVN